MTLVLVVVAVDFRNDDPALHLACDEILLEQAESGERGETLRFSEMRDPVVVLGIGSGWNEEIRLEECRARGVRVLRRCSGGGTVVLARGCLNYGLILDTRRDPSLEGVRESYGWILPRIAGALSKRGVEAVHAGLSDLAWQNRKIGGSAQKRKRRFILHHGTLLYDFDVSLLPALLEAPPEMPEYRAGRDHVDFVANIPLPADDLREAVLEAFDVPGNAGETDVTAGIANEAETLARRKYRSDEWTFRRR